MRKIRQFTDRPEQEQRPEPPHTHGLGCSAHNCPLVGVYGQIGGPGYCWAHDRLQEATQWPFLTQGIRNNQWLFRVAEKIATMPLYDLEKKSSEIDAYLKSQGRADLCRIKKNEGEWSERCEIEPRINWMARMRNAAYKAAFEYVECNWSRAA